VRCKSCGAAKPNKFKGEIAVHFPGLAGLDKPIVWVWPPVFVCMQKKAIRTRKLKSAGRKAAKKKRKAVARTALAAKKPQIAAAGAQTAPTGVGPTLTTE